ncbi:MAG: WecB/TagA/CpsF family glycosyltransferase [Bacillota bacterium]|nr:WecB/TagA/CpsF family glycosyltransferase [Bacillota bacterium]
MSRIDVLGVGFDTLTRNDTIELAKRLIDEHSSAYMVTPNPEIVMQTWESEEVCAAVNGANLVIPDGIGVVKASKLLGTPLKERLPGIEIAAEILKYIAESGKSAFLLGAKPGVAEMAAEQMKKDFPGINICGMNDGYFKDDGPVVEKINAAKPDFLLVCLGAPKQELWMAKNRAVLDVGLMAGLGGTLDVFAGTVQRAPEFWQKLNLEWFYRCLKEPVRFKRIYKLPLFLVKAMGKRLRKIFNGK